VDKIADFLPNTVGRFKALIADLAKATQIQADKARGLLRMLLGTAIVLHPMADGLDRYLTANVSPGTMRGYCGCSRVKINLVEGTPYLLYFIPRFGCRCEHPEAKKGKKESIR
jgi:hypothetical protein